MRVPMSATSEREWREHGAWDTVPDLALTRGDGADAEHLLVAVAHPDDETLAVGGLIHDAGRRGVRTTILVASDGGASHPGSPTHSPTDLARTRRRELDEALDLLNPRADLRCLYLGDGRLSGSVDTLSSEIAALADASTIIVSTWRRDGHPDHEAVGRAAAAAAREVGCRHLEAPIWAWEWSRPQDLPWARIMRHRCSPVTVQRKRSAIEAYRSQTQPLSADPADAPVLPENMLLHFARPFEAVVEQQQSTGHPVAAAVFDGMYASGEDPWQHEESWYEERKRALVLAALPGALVGRALELGPATGLLTVELARRATRVVSVDVSAEALSRARARVEQAGLSDHVELHHARVPDNWPDGRFETVVVSELAYFLTRSEWAATLRAIAAALTDDGALVLVHWAHPLDDRPLDSDTAHDMAAQITGLRTTVHHVEPDFMLRVLRPRGLPSLAAAEGRC